ncbi:peptidase C1A papain [Mycena leptocephala]|nr:peptidase C1A papain [Mycena leptocephala]
MSEDAHLPLYTFGWVPDQPDPRDKVLGLSLDKIDNLPSSVDLRPKFHFPVYNQGAIGSCTANAACGAFRFELARKSLPDFDPSRLFVYYNSRVTKNRDTGAETRKACHTLVTTGACEEALWPYDGNTAADNETSLWAEGVRAAQEPPQSAYDNASQHKAQSYRYIKEHDVRVLKACLNEGLPFVFGFNIYHPKYGKDFYYRGIVGAPPKGEARHGGHAVLAVGYDDAKEAFLVRNSRGEQWGPEKGYFWMNYRWFDERSLTAGNHADSFCVMLMDADD